MHCIGVHVEDQGQLYTNKVFFGIFMQKGRGNCIHIMISLVFHVEGQGELYTNKDFFGIFMQKGRGNCIQIRISLVFHVEGQRELYTNPGKCTPAVQCALAMVGAKKYWISSTPFL